MVSLESLTILTISTPSFTAIGKKNLAHKNWIKAFLYTDHFSIENIRKMIIYNLSHINRGIVIIYHVGCIAYLSNLHHFGQSEAVM